VTVILFASVSAGNRLAPDRWLDRRPETDEPGSPAVREMPPGASAEGAGSAGGHWQRCQSTPVARHGTSGISDTVATGDFRSGRPPGPPRASMPESGGLSWSMA
jgi:hypothetical protein